MSALFIAELTTLDVITLSLKDHRRAQERSKNDRDTLFCLEVPFSVFFFASSKHLAVCCTPVGFRHDNA